MTYVYIVHQVPTLSISIINNTYQNLRGQWTWLKRLDNGH